MLSRLNPAKATGPDGLPNWLLREFASLVAFPVKIILSASFSEQRLPSSWKYVDVTPLPKKMPVQNLTKDLRPISLTPCLSKVAEDFVVTHHLKPAVMKVLDSNQYGAVPKSSTTIALLSIIHKWITETDGNGSTVRAILFDYRKVFDLIDHTILIFKLSKLQSWKKVLGQIYICGTFANAPNKQSRANSSTLGQPLLPAPPPPYNVGHVYTLFHQSFVIVWEGGGGGVKQRNLKRITVLF